MILTRNLSERTLANRELQLATAVPRGDLSVDGIEAASLTQRLRFGAQKAAHRLSVVNGSVLHDDDGLLMALHENQIARELVDLSLAGVEGELAAIDCAPAVLEHEHEELPAVIVELTGLYLVHEAEALEPIGILARPVKLIHSAVGNLLASWSHGIDLSIAVGWNWFQIELAFEAQK